MTLLFRQPSLIAVLLAPGCPSAVFGRVRPIIVNSIQGHIFGGARAHIGKKSGKVIDPTVADRDATASPVWISFVLLVKASGFHVSPNAVFGRPFHAMFGAALARAFVAKATATFGLSALEATGKHDGGITAIAKALPVCMFAFDSDWAFRPSNNNKPSKALAGKVFEAVSAIRGMIEGHRESPVLGVRSRDVDASPAQFVGELTASLYHFVTQKTTCKVANP